MRKYGKVGHTFTWFFLRWNFDYERGPREIVLWLGSRRYGITF